MTVSTYYGGPGVEASVSWDHPPELPSTKGAAGAADPKTSGAATNEDLENRRSGAAADEDGRLRGPNLHNDPCAPPWRGGTSHPRRGFGRPGGTTNFM